MKFALALIICSYVGNTCLPPYVYPTEFEDQYDCFVEGYKQSMIKIEEIGREDVNEHEIYIRFVCSKYILKDNTKQDT